MATRIAQKTGNWSDVTVWDGGTTKPGAGDIAQTGAYTVTIDEDVTCTAIEATSSGHYEVTAGGITINANVVMASSYATNGGLRLTHATGTVTINGDISGTSGTPAVNNSGAGTLTVVGDVAAPPVTNARGINNNSTGTVNVTGNVAASSGNGSNGVRATGNGNINIIGNIVGGAGANASGVVQSGTGTIAITGDATAGAGASAGAYNEDGSGVITISGTATGGSEASAHGAHNLSTGTITVDQAIGGTNPTANGLYGANSGGTTTYKRIGSAANGMSAVGGFCKMVVDADYNVIVVKDSAGNDVSMSNDYPAVTDVKDGVVYNRTTLEGTLTELGVPDDVFILESAGGTYHAPSVGEVIDTAVFGAASGTAGTFAIPAEADVEAGVTYGAGGTEFEGTLVVAAGGGGVPVIGGNVTRR